MSLEPLATYRLQLHAGLDFDAAAALVPYLAGLGISHLYVSPVLEAAPGSTHGYDVVDPGRVSAALGGAAGFARLGAALRAAGMGLLVDLVPNHMATAAPHNPWWWDVLENGPASRFAGHFDVDWNPPEERLRDRLLLPVLGDHVGCEIEAGRIAVERTDATFVVRYHERVFPVAPHTLSDLLARAAARTGSATLAVIADALGALPLATATDQANVMRRHRDQEALRALLARLLAEETGVAAAVDAEVALLNRDPDRLDQFLERQSYRLARWRAADRDLGYRRFFDIDTLVALRMDDPRVFEHTHALLRQWVAEGRVDGLRIDHPDGLRDPETYCRWLRSACPGAWIVVEKILEHGERLRASWPVDGTTGYDFAFRAGGLFVDPAAEAPLTALWSDVTGETADWPAIVREKKLLACRDLLGSDVGRLAGLFLAVCERHRRHRDHTRHELTEALREVLAAFPVYRTYVDAPTGRVTPEDEAVIEAALAAAAEARPDLDPALLRFLGDLLTLRVRGDLEGELVMRFQQLSGPVMAKGVEDTAFYTFTRFAALNEVGGDPSRFGIPPDAFHGANADAQRRWPRSLLATSTHDTKRSEDVRARLWLLSEIPDRWCAAIRRWMARNARHRTNGFPDAPAELLFYQTLVGAWPIDVARATAYMEKATREARTHTSWTRPDPAYDGAVRSFVERTLADRDFVRDLEEFVAPLVGAGRVNGLALLLVKLTAPGVPDVYQGTELFDLSLVDPDNRRPVDWALRRRLLEAAERATAAEAWARADEGLAKLHVLRRALALRRRRAALFGIDGGYRALPASGARAAHVVAFARGEGVVTVVPRLVLGLDGWRDTTVPLAGGRWRNVLTDEPVAGGAAGVGALLAQFPVALLEREAP